jgi:hypothetical protein
MDVFFLLLLLPFYFFVSLKVDVTHFLVYQLLDDYEEEKKMSIRQMTSSRSRFLQRLAASINKKSSLFEADVKALLEAEDVGCQVEGVGTNRIYRAVDSIAGGGPGSAKTEKIHNSKKPRVKGQHSTAQKAAERMMQSTAVILPNSTAGESCGNPKLEYLQVLVGSLPQAPSMSGNAPAWELLLP